MIGLWAPAASVTDRTFSSFMSPFSFQLGRRQCKRWRETAALTTFIDILILFSIVLQYSHFIPLVSTIYWGQWLFFTTFIGSQQLTVQYEAVKAALYNRHMIKIHLTVIEILLLLSVNVFVKYCIFILKCFLLLILHKVSWKMWKYIFFRGSACFKTWRRFIRNLATQNDQPAVTVINLWVGFWAGKWKWGEKGRKIPLTLTPLCHFIICWLWHRNVAWIAKHQNLPHSFYCQYLPPTFVGLWPTVTLR